MLNPSMQELLAKVGNRYLLVNLAAQRARDLSDEAEENEESLDDKPVKLALDQIANGSISYCPGPRIDAQFSSVNLADLRGTLDLEYSSDTEEEPELFEDEDE